MNQANFLGRITRDIEVRASQGGTTVLNNTIAINRPFKNKQTGERDADFINFVAFGKTAEIIAQYHSKGDLIGLSGRMQSRNYENSNGQRVFVTELVVNEMHFAGGNSLNNGNDGQNQGYQSNGQGNNSNSYTQAYGANNQAQESNPFADSKGPVDIQDDDLPF